MSKITCNLKTIAFTQFCINMLFSYFYVSYNTVKFQTCSSWHSWVIATFRLSLLSKLLITSKVLHLEYFNMLFTYFGVNYNIVKFQTCGSLHSWVIATLKFTLLSKSVVIGKLLHLQKFGVDMLFSYFWLSYNIVKLQTCSSWHNWAIAIFRYWLLSKWLVTWKIVHLEYFVKICCSPTFGSAITSWNYRLIAHGIAEQ